MTEFVETTQGHIQLCTFWLNDCLFGIDILDVKEVNSGLDITSIHHSSKKVCGYVNIRGNIHLVLDMRILLGFDHMKSDRNCRVILFKPEVGEAFGVLVDRLGDVVHINEELIENRCKYDDIADVNECREEYELGIGVYKLDEDLLVILNPSCFLKSISD